MSAVGRVASRAMLAPCLALVAFIATPTGRDTRLTAGVTSGATAPVPTAGPARPAQAASAVAALQRKQLRVPIDDARVETMQGQFGDARDGGTRGHEAVDLLAPRNTEIHAVDDGTIEKLFLSKRGGLTIYQFDPSRRFAYYYAHLERYATGLREHQAVSRGDVIGFVGTSGNAPKNTPHLHFAIVELTPERQWWKGTPIDPWLAYAR